jgi:hypothetical protein
MPQDTEIQMSDGESGMRHGEDSTRGNKNRF